MKPEKEKSLDEQRCIMAYLDNVHARLRLLRELQFATGEGLRRRRTPMPSILDKAFRGEL